MSTPGRTEQRQASRASGPLFRSCSAALIAASVFAAGARAQGLAGAGNITQSAADALEAVSDDKGAFSLVLKGVTQTKLGYVTSFLKVLGPSLAIGSVVVDLLVPDPMEQAIDQLQNSVTGLYGAIQTAVITSDELTAAKTTIDGIVDNAGKLGQIRNVLRTYKAGLVAYEQSVKAGQHTIPPRRPDEAQSGFPDNYSNNIDLYAGELLTSCRGDVTASGGNTTLTKPDLQVVLEADDLALERTLTAATYINDWLLEAMKIYSDAFAIHTAFYPPTGVSGAALQQAIQTKLKTDPEIKNLESYVDACSQVIRDYTTKYSTLDVVLNDPRGLAKFLKSHNATLVPKTSAPAVQTIADSLAKQYPFFDWIVIRYPDVVGDEWHYMQWGGPSQHEMLPLFRTGSQDFNLVVAANTKGLRYIPLTNWTVNCGWYLDGLTGTTRTIWHIPNPSGGNSFVDNVHNNNPSIADAFSLLLSHCAPGATSIFAISNGLWIARVSRTSVEVAEAGERIDSSKVVSYPQDVPGFWFDAAGPEYRHLVMLQSAP